MPTVIERVKSAYNALFAEAPAPEPARARGGEIAYADPNRLFARGYHVTPYNPSALVTRKGMEIFDTMKRDDQVKAALFFKKHAVMTGGWQIELPEGQSEEWEPAKFIEWTLKNLNQEEGRILESSFDHAIIEILSAIEYGFSVTEKVLVDLTEGDYAGKIGLRALKARKPHSFDFKTDEFGNLTPDGILQDQKQKQVGLPREKFIVYVYQHQFSNWYGESDLEAAYRPWWIKDNSYKWLAMLLERAGVPPWFFLYGPNYSPQQVDNLKRVAQNLQAATSGVIPRPEKDALEIYSPELAGQATTVFIPSLEKFDKDIARAILMPSLIGATSDDKEGSYARSKTHFEMFIMIVEFIRSEVAAAINQQLVRPLVDLNYDVDEYPCFKFNPIGKDAKVALLDKWLQAIEKGVVEAQEGDEDHVRNLCEFPEKNEEDRKPPKEPAVDPDMDPKKPPFGKKPNYTVKFNRQKNRFERKVDFAQIEDGLNRLEDTTKERIKEILSESREALISYVRKNLEGKPGIVKDLRLSGMGDFQNTMKEFLRSSYALGEKTLRSELPKKFAEKGPSFVPVDALRFLNEKAVHISGVLKDRLLGQAKEILLTAVKNGEPMATTIQKLNDLFDPYVGDATVLVDGEAIAAYRLETIVRTNATEAFNQGRLVAARDPEIVRFMTGMEFSAVLDGRTTEVCANLDGKIFRMGDSDLSRLAPPLHFNCRSILVPVTPDIQVDDDQFATPTEIGRALEQAGQGFT